MRWMTWLMLILGGVRSWTHPTLTHHLMGAWRIGTDAPLLREVTVSLTHEKEQSAQCRIELHGSLMETMTNLSGIHHSMPSAERPWTLTWTGIRLVRPPQTATALEVRQMMRMLPIVYKIQRSGLVTNITSIQYRPPNLYTTIRVSIEGESNHELTIWRPVTS